MKVYFYYIIISKIIKEDSDDEDKDEVSKMDDFTKQIYDLLNKI